MVSHSPASRLGSPRLRILSALAARGSAILRLGSRGLRILCVWAPRGSGRAQPPLNVCFPMRNAMFFQRDFNGIPWISHDFALAKPLISHREFNVLGDFVADPGSGQGPRVISGSENGKPSFSSFPQLAWGAALSFYV